MKSYRATRSPESILIEGFPASLAADENGAEQQFASLAHAAVNAGDVAALHDLRELAATWLLADGPLPPSLREWLFYIVCIAPALPTMPTMHKGPRTDSNKREIFRLRLALFAAEYLLEHPRRGRAALQAAAGEKFRRSPRTIERHLADPFVAGFLRDMHPAFSRPK